MLRIIHRLVRFNHCWFSHPFLLEHRAYVRKEWCSVLHQVLV